MEANDIYMLMQKAYWASPAPYKSGFKFRMSQFTYDLLINQYKKLTKFQKVEVSTIFGVKIEIDDFMPDYVFHLYDNIKIEN